MWVHELFFFVEKKVIALLCDRGYSTAPDVEYLDNLDAHSLVRVNTNSLISEHLIP